LCFVVQWRWDCFVGRYDFFPFVDVSHGFLFGCMVGVVQCSLGSFNKDGRGTFKGRKAKMIAWIQWNHLQGLIRRNLLRVSAPQGTRLSPTLKTKEQKRHFQLHTPTSGKLNVYSGNAHSFTLCWPITLAVFRCDIGCGRVQRWGLDI
jgi:hypothetical protein